MSPSGLGCAETKRDEGVIGSAVGISAPGGLFEFLGATTVLMADLDGVRAWSGKFDDKDLFQARIAAISGLMPMMFMTLVRL